MTSTATIIRVLGKENSPGPGSYNLPSDFGQAPSWSIKHRYPDKQKERGAGYEMLENTVGTGPKYSLRSRQSTRDYVAAPGPTYIPPKLGEDATKSACHIRPDDKKLIPPGPGAGKYDLRPQTAGPKYTMKARQFPPDQGGADGPGGGKYIPEYKNVMPAPRQSQIGVVLREGARAATPGPGKYDIDRSLGKQTSCFHVKHRENTYDQTPGPKYDHKSCIGDAPGYSLRSRIDTPQKLLAPKYQNYENGRLGDGRKYTLHGRSKERDYVAAPGPTYIPPKLGEDATKSACHIRPDDKKLIPPGPGAGKYDLRPQTAGPKYTMKARQFPPDQGGADGPGGGKYLPDYERVLPATRRTQILDRFHEKPPEPGCGYVGAPSTLTKGLTIGRKEYLPTVPGIG